MEDLKQAKVGDFFFIKDRWGEYIKKVIRTTENQVHFLSFRFWKNGSVVGGEKYENPTIEKATEKHFEYFKFLKNKRNLIYFLENAEFEKDKDIVFKMIKQMEAKNGRQS